MKTARSSPTPYTLTLTPSTLNPHTLNPQPPNLKPQTPNQVEDFEGIEKLQGEVCATADLNLTPAQKVCNCCAVSYMSFIP